VYYALVYFPKIKIDRINKLRQKYDPTYNLIASHLTLLFPIPASLGKDRIINHIETVLKNLQSIKIRFGGFRKSWDHWLLLTLTEGNAEIRKLYIELYTGFLLEYRREDIEFIPHIGLGLFIKNNSEYDLKNPKELIFDEETYQHALLEAESLNLDLQCTVDNIELVELNDDFTKMENIKNFSLKLRDT
jgi:2'-5' RNA ligase